MLESAFRTDEYGKQFYIETDEGLTLLPYQIGIYTAHGMEFSVTETCSDGVLELSATVRSLKGEIPLKRLGFRLGIDSYMESYPDWNERYFPTALRCEKKGFWSCFMSPLGKMISVASPSRIVSWKHEYGSYDGDIVGHRILTSSIELINTYPQPARHPASPSCLTETPLEMKLYYTCPKSEEELYAHVQAYAGISVPTVNKFTLEAGETLTVNGTPYNAPLSNGRNLINLEGTVELSVYVRRDWFYYLDCARRSAELCQQKTGTHCESWYGYFSRILYAGIIRDGYYTRELCREFDFFFDTMSEKTPDGKTILKEGTMLRRLQNTSAMISLLTDFYEVTHNPRYLRDAGDLADFLMTLQAEDGSYRNKKVHYTCVIYPAKSMLELCVAERAAGVMDRYELHYNSALLAILDLERQLDNIETEGQMTFEDGMISCESLQLGYLATLLPDGELRKRLTDAAEIVLKKHRCLQQQILPDCRVRGCTARFWEARYDINFFANMFNSPHGWTSWKTYATYYLYMLTGKLSYLADTMDTMGACMQCVDEDGVLRWGFVLDPCVMGDRLKVGSCEGNIVMEKSIAGEEYLPMISDWWRQGETDMKVQYLHPWHTPARWADQYGASCDNDVHEHFKCLMETVFGKAFIHETEKGYVTYNCTESNGTFCSSDEYLAEWVIYSLSDKALILNGEKINTQKGLHVYADRKQKGNHYS